MLFITVYHRSNKTKNGNKHMKKEALRRFCFRWSLSQEKTSLQRPRSQDLLKLLRKCERRES